MIRSGKHIHQLAILFCGDAVTITTAFHVGAAFQGPQLVADIPYLNTTGKGLAVIVSDELGQTVAGVGVAGCFALQIGNGGQRHAFVGGQNFAVGVYALVNNARSDGRLGSIGNGY